MTLSLPTEKSQLMKMGYYSGLAGDSLTKIFFYNNSSDIKKEIIHRLAIGYLCVSESVFVKFLSKNTHSTSCKSASFNAFKVFLPSFFIGSLSTIRGESMIDKVLNGVEGVLASFAMEKGGLDDITYLQTVTITTIFRKLIENCPSILAHSTALAPTPLYLIGEFLPMENVKENVKKDNKDGEYFYYFLQEFLKYNNKDEEYIYIYICWSKTDCKKR